MLEIIKVTHWLDGCCLEGVRLSTGEVVSFTSNGVLKDLQGLGLKVDDPTDLVLTWDTVANKPTKYHCSFKNEILLDQFQPDKWLKVLKVTEKFDLHSGDVAFKTVHGFTVGIECKEGSDLYASLWRNSESDTPDRARLAFQIPRLIAAYDIPILHIDLGQLNCTPDGRIQIYGVRANGGAMKRTWSQMWNTLLGYQVMYPKLSIWVTKRTFRMPYDILQIRDYLNKIEHVSQGEVPAALRLLFEKQKMPKDMAWLAALVGPAAARAAFEAHHGIWPLLQLTKKELTDIPGWGPVTAELLLSTVGRLQQDPEFAEKNAVKGRRKKAVA